MNHSRQQRARRLLAVLLLLLPAALLAALALGSVSLGAGESARALGQLLQADTPDRAAVIIGQIRLPRALLAALVGSMLGISGAPCRASSATRLLTPH